MWSPLIGWIYDSFQDCPSCRTEELITGLLKTAGPPQENNSSILEWVQGLVGERLMWDWRLTLLVLMNRWLVIISWLINWIRWRLVFFHLYSSCLCLRTVVTHKSMSVTQVLHVRLLGVCWTYFCIHRFLFRGVNRAAAPIFLKWRFKQMFLFPVLHFKTLSLLAKRLKQVVFTGFNNIFSIIN